MNLYEKLAKVQQELKAPKSNFNRFGNFYYRSLEDIFEGVIPLLKKYILCLTIQYVPVKIGDRFYIIATDIFMDYVDKDYISYNAITGNMQTKLVQDDIIVHEL